MRPETRWAKPTSAAASAVLSQAGVCTMACPEAAPAVPQLQQQVPTGQPDPARPVSGRGAGDRPNRYECTNPIPTRRNQQTLALCAATSAASSTQVGRVLCVAGAAEPQQVVVQDDLDQLLDMLPADLGSLLIDHPKRPQLIEVRALHAACQPRAEPAGPCVGCQDAVQDAPRDAFLGCALGP